MSYDIVEEQLKEVKPRPDPVNFIEGELLPWKGRWFRLHYTKHEGVFALEMIKPTERSQQLAERKIRWQERHKQADKREVALHV